MSQVVLSWICTVYLCLIHKTLLETCAIVETKQAAQWTGTVCQCVIQSRSELGLKSYIFVENDKIILPEW